MALLPKTPQNALVLWFVEIAKFGLKTVLACEVRHSKIFELFIKQDYEVCQKQIHVHIVLQFI